MEARTWSGLINLLRTQSMGKFWWTWIEHWFWKRWCTHHLRNNVVPFQIHLMIHQTAFLTHNQSIHLKDSWLLVVPLVFYIHMDFTYTRVWNFGTESPLQVFDYVLALQTVKNINAIQILPFKTQFIWISIMDCLKWCPSFIQRERDVKKESKFDMEKGTRQRINHVEKPGASH